MERRLRRTVAVAVLSAGAAASLAGCGGSGKPASTTAAAPTVVTASVPAAAAGQLRQYRAGVRRVKAALDGFGAALAMAQGGPPDPGRLRNALRRFQAATDRLAGQRFADSAVAARQSQLVGASRAVAVVLATFTEDVAGGKLAEATALGPQINAALTAFAIAAAA